MATFPLPARRCLDLAAAAAPALLGKVLEQAVAALQQEELQGRDVARRQELADAWLDLMQRSDDWVRRYPSLLRAAQEADAPAAATPARGESRKPVLSLVDDAALTQSLEAARLTQLIAPRLEQPLAELDALMSSALGLATVQPERNPLRPDVFAQALRSLMQAAGRPEFPALWTRCIAAPLAGELEALYGEAVQLLRDADLQAARYRVLPIASPAAKPAPTPAPAAAAGGGWGGAGAGPGEVGPSAVAGHASAAGATGAPGPGGAPGGPAWADLSRYELGDELFQQFLFSRTPPASQGLAPAYYAEVEQQLAALAAAPEAAPPYDPQAALQYRTLPPVERPHRTVATASSLDDAVWGRWAPARERSLLRTQLKKQARQVGQVLGLEVVRKLVDQVARDPRLLAPVREAIVALEPALARLALLAPRFFSQEDHAARRLVERVAERSFKYNDEFDGEFHGFFGEVRSAFQGLNEAGIEDDKPFSGALARLEQRWAAQDELEARGSKVAANAMYFAEARQAEAGQIAWSLSQRSDLDGVPAVVQDFLYGPWSLVMAHARLTDGQRQIDPGGWNAVVTDLLWSVKPQQTLRDPARLIQTIPTMLERLRSGLAVLGQEPAQNDTFFQALEQLHRPVLKLRARQRQGSVGLAGEPELDGALLATERKQPRRDEEEPWMAPEELAAAGFQDTQPSAPAPLGDAPEWPAAGDAPEAHEAATAAPEPPAPPPAALGEGEVAVIVEGLRQGCWVDLLAHRRWRRASLTWVSSRATLFMFVSQGGRPHSMTRRSLERLVRERLLRPVETGAVVQRAIEELSQQRAPREPLAA